MDYKQNVSQNLKYECPICKLTGYRGVFAHPVCNTCRETFEYKVWRATVKAIPVKPIQVGEVAQKDN
jgi:transposase-like protein